MGWLLRCNLSPALLFNILPSNTGFPCVFCVSQQLRTCCIKQITRNFPGAMAPEGTPRIIFSQMFWLRARQGLGAGISNLWWSHPSMRCGAACTHSQAALLCHLHHSLGPLVDEFNRGDVVRSCLAPACTPCTPEHKTQRWIFTLIQPPLFWAAQKISLLILLVELRLGFLWSGICHVCPSSFAPANNRPAKPCRQPALPRFLSSHLGEEWLSRFRELTPGMSSFFSFRDTPGYQEQWVFLESPDQQ